MIGVVCFPSPLRERVRVRVDLAKITPHLTSPPEGERDYFGCSASPAELDRNYT
jgi:hypothetical protein